MEEQNLWRDIRFPAAEVEPLTVEPFLGQFLTMDWESSSKPLTFYHSQKENWHDDSTAWIGTKHRDSNMACWDYVG
jgi:hypothetical protein